MKKASEYILWRITDLMVPGRIDSRHVIAIAGRDDFNLVDIFSNSDRTAKIMKRLLVANDKDTQDLEVVREPYVPDEGPGLFSSSSTMVSVVRAF
ncbi:hypothetical protein OCU04_011155 [Sclerotinia nivalis]|uniref:Uncharacterized protein n=1 Tax=Sclerotinia nivalis TaxID=352851 RepID=A0A9X0DE64_9HELO|nr:hypothetical protein OCU04_011155 [Sclerotinia nivalis]